jgi:predicted nuclease of restriction endonuclease-like RecB superfamily
MNEVVEVFQKHQQDKRRMMLEHLEEIEKFDQLQVAQLLKGVLDDPALVMTQLMDLVKKARIDTVDLCLPEETCAPDPEEIPSVSEYEDRL